MIQLQLFDSNKNELALDDIILVHYPNPKVKFLGILKFPDDLKRFVLKGQGNDWQSVFQISWERLELIGNAKDLPDLIKHLGRYEKKFNVKKLEELLNQKFLI